MHYLQARWPVVSVETMKATINHSNSEIYFMAYSTLDIKLRHM